MKEVAPNHDDEAPAFQRASDDPSPPDANLKKENRGSFKHRNEHSFKKGNIWRVQPGETRSKKKVKLNREYLREYSQLTKASLVAIYENDKIPWLRRKIAKALLEVAVDDIKLDRIIELIEGRVADKVEHSVHPVKIIVQPMPLPGYATTPIEYVPPKLLEIDAVEKGAHGDEKKPEYPDVVADDKAQATPSGSS